MKGILGKKIGMTQVFASNGEMLPVTVLQIKENKVLQVKNKEIDGYNAIQLGVEDKKEKNSTKPLIEHSKKADSKPKRFIKEITLSDEEIGDYKLGQTLNLDIFEEGELVDIQGVSKGKGFQGAIKRHNQSRGPMSHGSRYHRRPGSMGAVAPAVFKGKNLPGHMGSETVTIQNLEIVAVDVENSALLIKGNVPGGKNSFVVIKEAIKKAGIKKEIKDLVGYSKAKEQPTIEE